MGFALRLGGAISSGISHKQLMLAECLSLLASTGFVITKPLARVSVTLSKHCFWTPKINWFMSLVDDDKRGSFTATKEAVSLLGGMVFTFIVGSVMDHYEAVGNNVGAFVFCSLGIVVLALLHTCTLIFSKEKPIENLSKVKNNQSIWGLLKNKDLLKIIFISSLWKIATYISTPFYGTYQIKELAFNMTFISIILAMNSIFRAIISRPVGKFADKSFVRVLKFCYFFGFLAFFATVFAVPSNEKIVFIIYCLLYGVAMSGIDNCEMNLAYSLVKEEERVGALALRMAISGLIGFITTQVISPFVTFIQNNGNKFLGLNVYAQQVLSALSSIIVIAILLFLTFNKGIKKDKCLDSNGKDTV